MPSSVEVIKFMTHFYLWLCALWLIIFLHFLPSKHACYFQCRDVRKHYQFNSFHIKTEKRAFHVNFKIFINRESLHSDSTGIFFSGFVLLMKSSELCFVQFKIYILWMKYISHFALPELLYDAGSHSLNFTECTWYYT